MAVVDKKRRGETVRFAKEIVVVNAFVPLAMLGWDLASGRAGANPLEFATHTTGMLALIFVVLSLAVTPVRRVSGATWIAPLRRMVGLLAFTYGTLHLCCYVWFDKGFSVLAVVDDVAKRPFIAVGMATWLAMVPLAVTSTDAMLKRVGGKTWRRLHRLNYAIGLGAVLHFWMLVKADWRLPLAFFVAVALLLGFRVAAALRDRQRRARSAASA
jgi:DMSO/TMAO reductase YedYZ heme-binding membrane subunit